MTRKSLVRGAAILAFAGLINRVLGAVSRIILPSMIGDEGVGLFQMAYPVYNMFLVVSTAGIPVAVSKLVAERDARRDRRGALLVLRVASLILLLTGSLFTLLLFWGSDFLSARVLRDVRAAMAIRATAPAVLILSVMSGFRGFFQGIQNMTPSALSQITEQIVRVSAMLGLAYLLLPRGIAYSAAGASFGAVLGGAVGLILLLISYYRFGSNQVGPWGRWGPEREISSPSFWSVANRIFALSLPIVIGASIMPLMQMVDAGLVPSRLLHAGYTGSTVTRLYGQLTGMAMPLVYFPTIATMALAASAVPAVSEALAMGDRRLVASRAEDVIRFSVAIGLPSSVGLFVLAPQICELLFNLPEAGIPLRAVAFGAMFLCLQQTTSGLLQGMGKVSLPVKNLLVGSLIKAFINYFLTGLPAFGIRGAALGTVAGFGVASLLNLKDVIRNLGLTLEVRDQVTAPLAASLGVALVARPFYSLGLGLTGSGGMATLLAIAASAFLYGLILLVGGGIKKRDLAILPHGERVASLLERLGFLRG